jgi:hypothetical protein
VKNGKIDSFTEVKSIDQRVGGDGAVPCEGNWLFGCSFGVPLSAVIKVNGFDEYHDGLGAEDTDFGMRLNRAGCKTYYNANAMTTESYEMHFQEGTFHRENRKAHTGEDVDWYLINRLNEQPKRYTTLGNWTNIEELRAHVADGGDLTADNLPVKDWATKKPYDEIFAHQKAEM